MITRTLLTLVVTILSVDEGVATIDKGQLVGLLAGDAGRIYYQLTVGATSKRIDVGEGTILAVDDSTARLRIDGDAKVQPGYFVEFEIPLVGSGSTAGGVDPALRALIARLVPGNRLLQAEVERLILERGSLPERAADPVSDREAELRARLAELEAALATGARDAEVRVRQAEARQLELEADAAQARKEVSRLARQLEFAESGQRQLQTGLSAARSEASRPHRAEHQPEVSAPPAVAAPPEPGAVEPGKADPGTADPGTASAAAAPTEDAEVLARIRDWARAWSEQRVGDYLALYARDFRPPEGQRRDQWEAERKLRVLRPSFINVQVKDLKFLSLDATRAAVTFRQLYRADAVAVGATKIIKLAKEDGEWKILEEAIQE